jgi:hypothetical protein
MNGWLIDLAVTLNALSENRGRAMMEVVRRKRQYPKPGILPIYWYFGFVMKMPSGVTANSPRNCKKSSTGRLRPLPPGFSPLGSDRLENNVRPAREDDC